MSKAHLLATAASLAVLFAGAPAVYAQSELTGIEALDDRIDDIEEDVEEEFEEGEDPNRFGNQTFGPGWTGSVSASGNIQDGNTDSRDFTLAGRVRNSTGPWNQSLGLAFDYGKDDDVENEREIFAIYDLNRDLTEQLYVFGLARAQYDEFGAFNRDLFAGAGPGFRIFNRPDLAWRVQAGPGVRFTEENGTGEEETELGAIASSFFYYQLSDGVAFTNDTEVLYSEANTLVANDAGVNFRVSDVVSTRLAYRTEWNSDPTPGFEDTENELAAALVFSLN